MRSTILLKENTHSKFTNCRKYKATLKYLLINQKSLFGSVIPMQFSDPSPKKETNNK
jgi:hypothetical protein